ncbi:hypothetical protein VPH35_107788 [Triticum aestivum]
MEEPQGSHASRSPPASAPPLDDENLLEEILFRLPPSSILRASLVCKSWHGILADRRFLQRFREHHQKPPLLGYFDRKFRGASFTPMAGFTPVLGSIPRLGLLNLVDCRHGVALFLDHARREILLWNPIAGVQRHVAFPYLSDILQLDFKNRTLVVINKPTELYGDVNCWYFQPLRTEDGGLGLAVSIKLSIQLWATKSNGDDVVSWVLQKTVELDDQISHPLFASKGRWALMMGYDEDTNVIFLSYESRHHFMLQLDSMQFRHISTKPNLAYSVCYPYRDFYTEEAPQ